MTINSYMESPIEAAFDTSSVLAAALEELNRASVVSVLDSLIGAMNSLDADITTQIGGAKDAAAVALSAAVKEIKTATDKNAKDINDRRQELATLTGKVTAQINAFPKDLDEGVKTGLKAQKEAITSGVVTGVTPKIEERLNETLIRE